jgi:hypothetical protein
MAVEPDNEFYETVQKIVARAWTEPDYKARLRADPKSAMSEMGLAIPDGVKLNVVEDNKDVWHFVLPEAPTVGTLSDMNVFASSGSSSCGKCSCIGKCYAA